MIWTRLLEGMDLGVVVDCSDRQCCWMVLLIVPIQTRSLDRDWKGMIWMQLLEVDPTWWKMIRIVPIYDAVVDDCSYR